MISLLELIFQGFAEWVYSLVLECWNYFSSALLDIMSLDFTYIKTHVPVVNGIMEVFLAVGWALLLGNLVFQAVRSMASGLGFEGEDPKMLFARTFVFAFLLLASPQICEIGLDLTSRMIALLEIPDTVDVHLVDDSVFGTLTVSWFLIIIFDIIIMFKVLSLLLEVAERYVILAVLSITAPLAFSMGGSKSTAEIFTGWCRMFGSMCLLMVTNVMFFKMLLSVVSSVPSGLDVFPWMVLIITIVKVAKKADEIITRIGLNPAITGDRGKGFGNVLAYTLVRNAAARVVKTVGAAATGGASTAAGAAVGGLKSAAGAAGVAGASGMTGVAGTAGAVGAADTVNRAGGQTAQRTASPQEQQGAPASQGGTNDMQGGQPGQGPRGDGSSRKSSVPPGVRRAASHVSGGGVEEPVPKRSDGRTARGPGGGPGRTGGSNGAGTGGVRWSGRDRMVRRGVDVYADDFEDGYDEVSKRKGSVSTGAAAGGGRGRPAGPAGTAPPSAAATRKEGPGKRDQTTIQGSSSPDHWQTDVRSTQRNGASLSGQPETGYPGGTGTGRGSPTQTASQRKQRSTNTVPQKQRTASAIAEPAARSGGAGKRSGGVIDSRARRQSLASARKEPPGQPQASGVSGKGGGSAVPPGPAGTGSGSYSERSRRSGDRSPSPARQGIIPKDGTPSVHPGTAGIGGVSPVRTDSSPKRRSSNPVRQEQDRGSTSAESAARSGGPVIRLGPAGTGGSTFPQPQQRSTGTARQEAGAVPEPPGSSARSGGPIVRPGSAGTSSSSSAQASSPKQRRSSPAQQEAGTAPAPPKSSAGSGRPIARPGPAGTGSGQTGQTRTSKTKPGKPGAGGPEHGKPSQ